MAGYSAVRHGSLGVATAAIALMFFTTIAEARKKDPEFATSPNDPVLRARIIGLAPTVDPAEAQRVAEIAYNTGRQLRQEWGVVWPPGVNNFLINTGAKKGGLCFQYAEALLLRLSDQKWETLEFHWAESFERTISEHNVIVVTAKGQHFSRGIILDNWRYGGRLVWGAVIDDPHYDWHENKLFYQKVLNKRAASRPSATPKPSGDKEAAVSRE
ncbi:MAG: hypothetical protein ACJ8M4_06665 [Chthoniobacterales bacterium]